MNDELTNKAPETVALMTEGPIMDGKPTTMMWQVGQPVPGDDTFVIYKIFVLDGTTEIFAYPKPNTAQDQAKKGMFIQLFPSPGIRIAISTAHYTVMKQMIDDAENPSDEDDEDDDEAPEQADASLVSSPSAIPMGYVPMMSPVAPNGQTPTQS